MKKSRTGLVVAIFVVLALAIVAGAVVVASQQDDSTASSDSKVTKAAETITTTAIPTTTTEPRVNSTALLSGYCDAPGKKWPEVPVHQPGQPDRTYVRYQANVQTNGYEISEGTTSVPVAGSTVISPHTDHAFTNDPSVLARTRTVACITFDRTESTGKICHYVPLTSFGQPDPYNTTGTDTQLGRNRFMIIVYELHSGGVLHKGEIWSRTGECPARARTDIGNGMVTRSLTDNDILDWLSSHFVDGAPH